MRPCGSARGRGAATPSEEREIYSLDGYLGLRDSLRAKRSGHGGREVCEALTAGLDEAIRNLVSPLPEGAAVVAIGGYGRGELSLYSDVDLMLLHELDDPSELAAALFRPLWDARFRVGHSVRTLREASAAAKEVVDTHTTLLTSRLVSGDEGLFAGLMDRVSAVTKARPLRRHLVSEERRRRAESPYLLMATDVKEGRGGLRTIHGIEWEERREELIGRFTANVGEEAEAARERLLQVRNSLHAVAGRSHDVFSVELREPVAAWLGLETFEMASTLVDAMHTVDRLATRRWPEVVEERPKGVLARLMGRPPPLSARSEPSLDELIWILETGEEGRLAFQRLREAGLLHRVLPEWDGVESLPQLAPFHEHPVASHLWRTTDEMQALVGEGGHYGRVADEVEDPAVLLLAAFLHDIGKGRPGDHSVVGAAIAGAFCRRMRIDSERSKLIEGAVRHHLLLARTATRRDLDDPGVIDEIAGRVGDLRLLQVLYLLTVADSKATGPTMWGDWKATLLRTLFARCAARFGADRPAHAGTTREDVLAAAGVDPPAGLVSHLDGMPAEYLRNSSTADVLWHVRLIQEKEGASNAGIRPGDPVESAVVVGEGRPGFRHRVAEAFAANGVDVLEARMLTRSDGMILDTFVVRDDRTRRPIDPEKWRSFRSDLEAALMGDLDIGAKLAERAAAYGPVDGEEPMVRVEVDAASGRLMVTIKCSDRIGRLAEILGVLDDCDLDIGLAKIDSREGGVIDTFHVDGEIDLEGPGRILELERRIADGLAL